MRNQEITSAFTSNMPNKMPAKKYLKLYHQGCCRLDSLIHIVSSERTSKSVFCSINSIFFELFCIHYNCKINGRIRFAIIKPPAIKQTVATNEGHCRLLNPIIA